uniref:Uncharacterized protein n=1 Tax=viral metagenome TaxID=1070528 RepID=A0A6M3XHX7_9ZZZZ
MHDIKDHINAPCPQCGKRELHWSKRQICCLDCDCDWTLEELLAELEKATLPSAQKSKIEREENEIQNRHRQVLADLLARLEHVTEKPADYDRLDGLVALQCVRAALWGRDAAEQAALLKDVNELINRYIGIETER